jgi:hypothetical protein
LQYYQTVCLLYENSPIMKKLIFICLFLMTNIFYTLAQNSLSVSDPRTWSKYGRGKIEESTISVTPKGIYSEVNMYFTFSSNATSFTSVNDTLEVVFNFSLPAGSLVTDSWLWVDTAIVRADIVDRWTATAIYEGIVKRRKDPSLLVKNGNNYELRIFPMAGNQNRKVKMTFLLLNQWNPDGTFELSLPLSMLKAGLNSYCYYYYDCSSNVFPESCKLIVRENEIAKVGYAGTKNNEYTLGSYSDKIGEYKSVPISPNDFVNDFKLSFHSTKLKNGIFLNTFPVNAEEGYYQMLILPGKALDLPIKRKTVFLIDYDQIKTSLSSASIYNGLKSFILKNYTPKDSFALFVAGLNITGTGPDWIKGDSTSITNVFQNLGQNPIKDYSNLTPLLSKGSEFIQQKGAGDIMIVSASEHGFSPANSTTLINEYVASLKTGTRVFIVDLTRNYTTYSNSNGVAYFGDGYFYSSIARLTNGVYYSCNDYPLGSNQETVFNEMLNKAVDSHSGAITSFDLSTSLLNGFCSGRFSIGQDVQSTSLNAPIIQVGKYFGTQPFITQLSGIFNGKAFSKRYSVEENELSQPDSITKTIWSGRYLLSRESQPQINPVISDIIDVSLKNRVLSNYTAFLALEPSMNGKVCSTCYDESESPTAIGEEQLALDSVGVIVFPSPVTKEARILINDYLANESNSSLKLFNTQGEIVKEFDLSGLAVSRGRMETSLNIEDSDSQLKNGVYFLQYLNGARSKRTKVLIQKQ